MVRKHKNELQMIISKVAPDGVLIYKAEPFQSFYEECDFCNYFMPHPPIAEGGTCSKHNIGCGWGLTCDDYKVKSEKDKRIRFSIKKIK